jgi:hypothetical protein
MLLGSLEFIIFAAGFLVDKQENSLLGRFILFAADCLIYGASV